VARKSIIQASLESFSEAFRQKKNGDVPERAKEHAPEGLSRDPKSPLVLSISLLLKDSFTCPSL